jgi:hypothetical protein
MKNIIKMAGVMAATLALAQTIQATPLSGNIGFTGQVELNNSSPGNSSGVTMWLNPTVNGTSGAFAGLNGMAATFTPTWTFNTASTISPFWSVDGFTFVLTSSAIVVQGFSGGLGYVVVDGTGTVTGPGYTTTPMIWTFGLSDPPADADTPSWTFRASANSVPDGGATVMLLGIALSGVALLKKKLMA